jgi:hypothetical protein
MRTAEEGTMTESTAFDNPASPGNSPRYHTGKPCIVAGCDKPAGTAWGPYWCFEHNVDRLTRIDGQLRSLAAWEQKESGDDE